MHMYAHSIGEGYKNWGWGRGAILRVYEPSEPRCKVQYTCVPLKIQGGGLPHIHLPRTSDAEKLGLCAQTSFTKLLDTPWLTESL